ncbi:MAG: hypothetical protein NT056_09965 [Proteobacteria bacterium]|jgi:hypothetical protein|nr:hypothetical protein [Pseudomonadota bacterium]
MAQKVTKVGVKREKGWLYYIDKQGNVARKKMARGGAKKQNLGKAEVVSKTGIKREDGFLYFIDKQGDISRAEMARKKKKKK